IWAGSNDGLVHVTRDGGGQWTDVTGNLPKLPPWGKITNIAPSFFDAGTAYLAVDLHELDDLAPYIYKTTDYGKSWKRISDAFPRSSLSFVHVVAEDPVRRGLLYAGTEHGLYVTLADSAHPPAKLIVVDARGDTVRVLQGERQPGLNRVWWDLRYSPTVVTKLRTPPPGKPFVRVGPDGTRPLVTWDLDLMLRGPPVPPGTYGIRLRVGDTTLTQSLTVLKDPNTAGTDADVQAQTLLALAIRAEQDSVARMINRLEWVRKQLLDRAGQLRTDSATASDARAKRLATQADSLERRVADVEGVLFDVHLTGAREDAFRNPMQLYGRLAALQSDVADNGADFAPTTHQLAVH